MFVSCLFKIVLSPGVVCIVHMKGFVILLHMKTLLMIIFWNYDRKDHWRYVYVCRKTLRQTLLSDIEGNFHLEYSEIKAYFIGKISFTFFLIQVLSTWFKRCIQYNNALQFQYMIWLQWVKVKTQTVISADLESPVF